MSLIGLILVIVIIGVILWLINTFIPMDPKIKTILNIAVVIILILWLVSIFLPGITTIQVPIRR